MRNIEISNKVIIEADNVMGHTDENRILRYSENTGKCILENVKILRQEGIPLTNSNKETDKLKQQGFQLHLKGNSEFYAKDVTFIGDYFFEVEDGYRLIISQKNENLQQIKQKIEKPSWHWKYFVNDDYFIQLEKE